MKRRVLILGSTGSIGKNCLDVVRANPDKLQVVGLAAQSNVKELAAQIKEFKPKKAAIVHEVAWKELKASVHPATKLFAGPHGATELVEALKPDLVVSAIVGAAGLIPALAAIKQGIRVALANKEPLVMAGSIMMSAARKYDAQILPIDSEHSAIWQCLNGEPRYRVKKLILTASGGPFLHATAAEIKKVTVAQALKHPRWKMGRKITIDSSTMMNKGLEVIEARWLYDMPAEKIEVVIHPQSIIHSMVEFVDTSVMAQIGLPDMRVPIAYALSYPDRWPASRLSAISFTDVGRLEFFKPDIKRFPCLRLAYESILRGGVFPAAMNAANEVAVEEFLAGQIRYIDIPRIIEKTMDKMPDTRAVSLETVMEADGTARAHARVFCRKRRRI